jgi:hypothetical protein
VEIYLPIPYVLLKHRQNFALSLSARLTIILPINHTTCVLIYVTYAYLYDKVLFWCYWILVGPLAVTSWTITTKGSHCFEAKDSVVNLADSPWTTVTVQLMIFLPTLIPMRLTFATFWWWICCFKANRYKMSHVLERVLIFKKENACRTILNTTYKVILQVHPLRVRSIGLWWRYINITITILNIIHPPDLYLKLSSTL